MILMFRMQKYGLYSRFSPVGHLPPSLIKDSETPVWLGLNIWLDEPIRDVKETQDNQSADQNERL